MAQRVYTMRKCCLACLNGFTLNGSAQKYCKDTGCSNRRRKADRLARKAARQPRPSPGSEAHLAQAVRSGE